MARWDTRDDESLLRAATSDPDAFTAFYRRYERLVLAYFLRRTADAELAADLTAEVFAAVMLSCRRYRPGPPGPTVWLFAIARHKLADSRRRGVVADAARRRLRMEPVELDNGDLERIEREAGHVFELLAELPADQREAIQARIIEERPYEAIAGQLACSPGVVRKRVSRGLNTLRERLSEERL